MEEEVSIEKVEEAEDTAVDESCGEKVLKQRKEAVDSMGDVKGDGKIQYPVLVFNGFKPNEDKFVETSIDHIVGTNLDAQILTNGFVLELYSLVHQPKTDPKTSTEKLSPRDFAAIIGCLIYKWIPEEVTKEFIKKVAYRRDLDNMKEQVKSDKLGKEEPWKKLKTLSTELHHEPNKNKPATRKSSESVCSPGRNLEDTFGSETNDTLARSDLNHLIKHGILVGVGSDDTHLLDQLEHWTPTKEDITNGVVLEIALKRSSKCIFELIKKIFQVMKVHPTNQSSGLVKKQFFQYIKRTTNTCLKQSDLEEPWLFWKSLSAGGKLFKPHLLLPLSKFDETIQNLTKSLEEKETEKCCNACGSLGDHFCCQGCFMVFYCSTDCQTEDWAGDHHLKCSELSSKILGEGAKLPPLDYVSSKKEKVMLGKYRNSLKLISQKEKKYVELLKELKMVKNNNEELYDQNKHSNDIIKQLKSENEHLKETLKKTQKEKAGKSSALVKLKRKFNEIENDSEDELENEEVKIKASKSQTLISL